MATVDGALKHLGELGRYQLGTFFIAGIIVIPMAFLTLQSVFTLGLPNYRCAPIENGTAVFKYTDLQPTNVTSIENGTAVFKYTDLQPTNVTSASKCLAYSDLVTNESAACSSWVYEETYYQPSAVMEFNLVCDKAIFRSTANVAYMLGMLAGSVVGGELSDRFGRKKTVIGFAMLAGVGGVASGLAPNIYWLLVFRFFNAAGILTASVSSFVLIIETVGASWRHVIGIAINIFWVSGTLLLIPLAYLLRNWRHLTLVTSCSCFLFAAYWWVLPESVRWSLAKGRRKEYVKSLHQMEKVNKRRLPDGFLEKLGADQPQQKEESIVLLMKNKTCLKRFLIMALNWIACSTAYYGLSLSSGNYAGDLYTNYAVSCLVEVPAYLFVLFAPMRFGRRSPHAFCMILGGASCLASLFVVLFGKNEHQWILTVLSTIGKFGASGGFASVYVYTLELFPTKFRNRTLGLCSMSARIGNLVAPFLTDLGSLISGRFTNGLPLIVLGAISLTAGVLSLFLPDTYKTPLPDTLEDASAIGMKPTEANKTEKKEHCDIALSDEKLPYGHSIA